MPATAKARRDQRQYQLPLPLTGDPRSSTPPRRTTGDRSWRLDEQTRRAGRRGVAAARAALAGAGGPENGRQADAA